MNNLNVRNVADSLARRYHSANWENGVKRVDGIDSFFDRENDLLILGRDGQKIIDNPQLMKEIGETIYKADTREKVIAKLPNSNYAKQYLEMLEQNGHVCYDLFASYQFARANSLPDLLNCEIPNQTFSHFFSGICISPDRLSNYKSRTALKEKSCENEESTWKRLEKQGLDPEEFVIETDQDYARYGNIIVDILTSTVATLEDNKHITLNHSIRDDVLKVAKTYAAGDIKNKSDYAALYQLTTSPELWQKIRTDNN